MGVVMLSSALASFNDLSGLLSPVIQAKSNLWNSSAIVVAVRQGNKRLALAAGYNNMQQKVPATVNDKFLFGSATKMLTATSVLKLVEAGTIALDEPAYPGIDALIAKAAPKTRYKWRSLKEVFGPTIVNVTVRHLLHMTSGILDYDNGNLRSFQNAHPMYDITPWDILNMAPKKFACPPGTCGAYSSTNFVLLGLLLAHHANASDWDTYDQRQVFLPQRAAQYNRTFFPLHGPCSKFPHVAHGYQQPPPGYFDVFNISCLGGWTCGNLAAPIQDVADFTYDLFGPEEVFVSNRTKQEMQKFGYLAAGAFPAWYGLGTMLLKFSNHSSDHKYHSDFVGHGGATYGFYSMTGYHKEHDFSLAIGTNMETPVFQENMFDEFNAVYYTVVNALIPPTPAPAPTPTPTPTPAHALQ